MIKITPMLSFNEIHNDYDFFKNVRDNLGRSWKLAAFPKHGGSFAYFRNITELRHWVGQVEEIRQMERGEKTTLEKVVEHLNASYYPEEKQTLQRLAEKLITKINIS